MIFHKLGVSEVSLGTNTRQEQSEDILLNFETKKNSMRMTCMGRYLEVDTGLQISQLDFTKLYLIFTFRFNILI
jgi:hypothetical protein